MYAYIVQKSFYLHLFGCIPNFFFRLSTLADYSSCCSIVGSDIVHTGATLSSVNFITSSLIIIHVLSHAHSQYFCTNIFNVLL